MATWRLSDRELEFFVDIYPRQLHSWSFTIEKLRAMAAELTERRDQEKIQMELEIERKKEMQNAETKKTNSEQQAPVPAKDPKALKVSVLALVVAIDTMAQTMDSGDTAFTYATETRKQAMDALLQVVNSMQVTLHQD
jgi:hypothetical protein